jgi:citryl-CoA lyase
VSTRAVLSLLRFDLLGLRLSLPLQSRPAQISSGTGIAPEAPRLPTLGPFSRACVTAVFQQAVRPQLPAQPAVRPSRVGFRSEIVYHRKMRKPEDRLSGSRSWATSITRVEHNRVEIASQPISQIVGKRTFPEAVHLLFQQAFPKACRLLELNQICHQAAALPAPSGTRLENESVSQTIAKHLLSDAAIASLPAEGPDGECSKTVFCLGRVIRAIDSVRERDRAPVDSDWNDPFAHWLYRSFTADLQVREERARMLEAMIVACIDHGVTPPSTQACRLAASARVPYEVAVALGVSGMSDIHGGASGRAAAFFAQFLRKKKETDRDSSDVLAGLITEALSRGERIPGLGHRVHTEDPRCAVLWSVAQETGVAAECVQASRLAAGVFSAIRGIPLPINIDGVMGAIVADMDLPPVVATMAFILGRVAGLSAHYFEEVRRFPVMRWIDFAEAAYQENTTRILRT